MTAEQKNLIYNLRKAGQSYTVIADKLGFSKSAIATYCQRNGLGSILVENNLITKSNRVKVGDAEKPGGFISKASRAYKVHYKFRDSTDNGAVESALEILRTRR